MERKRKCLTFLLHPLFYLKQTVKNLATINTETHEKFAVIWKKESLKAHGKSVLSHAKKKIL